MTAWTNDELHRIGTAQELEVAPLRADGRLRQPVTIWVIRDGDDLYVRSWRGRYPPAGLTNEGSHEPEHDFHGRVAVITGAASGMGLATAHALAAPGAAVVLADHNEQTLRPRPRS